MVLPGDTYSPWLDIIKLANFGRVTFTKIANYSSNKLELTVHYLAEAI